MMKIFIMNGMPRAGKALANSEVLPTPNGKKRVDEIKVGDFLFDRKGKPTKVLGIYPQGKKDVYEVIFKDGRKVRCCEDHLWNIHKNSWHREKSKNLFVPYSTKQIIEEGIKLNKTGRNRFSIQNSPQIEFSEKNFTIHPYIMGAFLGDGCCLERLLTLSSNDIEIVERINFLLGNHGYKKNSKNNYSWCFSIEKGHFNKNNVELKRIQTNDFFKGFEKSVCVHSYEKSIPEIYKYGSIEQRFELIRGLMDTDGSISKDGLMRFTSTSKKLIEDLKDIIFSLGYSATVSIDNRAKYTKNICYSLLIKCSNEEKEKFFFLSRKKKIAQNLPETIYKHKDLKIIAINKLNYQEEMTCFYVDNEEHLFLATDYIVTHNTTLEQMITEIAKEDNKIIKIYSTIDYVKSIAKKFGWNGEKEPKDRKMLSDLKDVMTEWGNVPFRKTQQFIRKSIMEGCSAVFIDSREPEEIEKFVKTYDAITVLVKRKDAQKQKISNHADANVDKYKYDIVINNSKGLNELKHSAEAFYENYIKE